MGQDRSEIKRPDEIQTVYAVFAQRIDKEANHEDEVICTGLHKTSKKALEEFDKLIEDGALQYINPDTKHVQKRDTLIFHKPWEEYEIHDPSDFSI